MMSRVLLVCVLLLCGTSVFAQSTPTALINGVKLADCRCPLGETLDGGPVALGQSYITDAAQCALAVGGPIPAQ